MPAANVACRNTLHNSQAFGIWFDKVKSLLVGGTDFEERLVLFLLVLESRLFKFH